MATKTKTNGIDLAGLISDGHLDLDAIFGQMDFEKGDLITSYLTEEEVEVYLTSATAYGLTVYRWEDKDSDGDTMDAGEISLSKDEVVKDAEKHAEESETWED